MPLIQCTDRVRLMDRGSYDLSFFFRAALLRINDVP
jgi:hypothetical protein